MTLSFSPDLLSMAVTDFSAFHVTPFTLHIPGGPFQTQHSKGVCKEGSIQLLREHFSSATRRQGQSSQEWDRKLLTVSKVPLKVIG